MNCLRNYSSFTCYKTFVSCAYNPQGSLKATLDEAGYLEINFFG